MKRAGGNLDEETIDRIPEKSDKAIKVQKRADVIDWDDYFMSVAYLSALRSKDPSTQVGACIVNEDKRIVGIGYNGFPRGCRYETPKGNYSCPLKY